MAVGVSILTLMASKNPFSYSIDYDKEIAQDLAVLADCDRSDALVAMLPGMVALVKHYNAEAHAFFMQDFLGYCADLDFVQKVADVVGVTLEELVNATDHDYNQDDAWALWRAFEAKYGRSPRGHYATKENIRVQYYALQVMLPHLSKSLRKKTKADLARHKRNKAKHAA